MVAVAEGGIVGVGGEVLGVAVKARVGVGVLETGGGPAVADSPGPGVGEGRLTVAAGVRVGWTGEGEALGGSGVVVTAAGLQGGPGVEEGAGCAPAAPACTR